MAETAAERQRRSRAHRAGDHRPCDPRRCPEARGRAEADLPAPPGNVTGMLAALFAPLHYPPTDPRAVMCQIALQYGMLIDQQGVSPGITGELRRLIAQVTELPNDQPDVVDELRLRAARKRAEIVLEAAETAAIIS